jgi:hypothetical protein
MEIDTAPTARPVAGLVGRNGALSALTAGVDIDHGALIKE